ncbi:MAG: PAS domain S-box protein [Desulfobacula sp.]|nr:PAS domain S-box protein [Desulfobacula sp.]
MEKPKQVNVSRRLIFSFCVLILLFLFFGLFTLYENQITSRLARTIYNHPLIVSNAALQSNASIMKMHRDMKDVVLFESLSRIQQSLEAVNQQEQQVYQNLDIVRNKILGNEGKLLENEARILFDGWRPIREEVISLVRKDQRQKATEITIGKDADHVAKLEEKMLELTDYARNKASFFIREAEKSYSRANLSLIILLLSGLFVSSLIALFTLKYTASSEKELRESRQLIENAIDFAPIGLVLLKPDGNFFRVNQAFNDMIGYSEKELSKMTFQDITHPDDYDIGPEFIQNILRGDTNKASLEKRYVKKDGSIINVFLTTTLLKDNKDKPHYFFNQVQDITERKKIEEELRKSERLHREAQRVAKIGHWELNSPSGTPTWSEEIFHIFGLDPKKSGPSFAAHANIIHDEDWGLLDNSIQELSTNGTPFDLEFRIVLPNGEIRWMHAKGSADKSEDGSVTRMFGTAQDITERKQAELVMRESEKRLRALSFQLIDAQEKERRRISQELHDEMGQVLTAIVLNLTEIENQMSSDKAQILINIFADTHSLLDQTAHQIRELT